MNPTILSACLVPRSMLRTQAFCSLCMVTFLHLTISESAFLLLLHYVGCNKATPLLNGEQAQLYEYTAVVLLQRHSLVEKISPSHTHTHTHAGTHSHTPLWVRWGQHGHLHSTVRWVESRMEDTQSIHTQRREGSTEVSQVTVLTYKQPAGSLPGKPIHREQRIITMFFSQCPICRNRQHILFDEGYVENEPVLWWQLEVRRTRTLNSSIT